MYVVRIFRTLGVERRQSILDVPAVRGPFLEPNLEFVKAPLPPVLGHCCRRNTVPCSELSLAGEQVAFELSGSVPP